MRTDVIFSWFCGGTVEKNVSLFTRPTRHIALPVPDGQHYMAQFQEQADGGWRIGGWPHPLRAMIARANMNVEDVGRVALVGFSQGCQGVRAVLASQDAGFVEHAIAIDGIHSSWNGGTANAERSNVEMSGLGPWIGYADMASRGAVAIGGRPPGNHYCTITHSAIVPPFPSTTETAKIILDKLFGSGWPHPSFGNCSLYVSHADPVVIKGVSYPDSAVRYSAGQHGLVVVGYSNLDAASGGVADHIYQANEVLPRVMRCLLAPRWNEIDPNAPTCTSPGVAGPQCNGTAPVLVSSDASADASIDWQKISGAPPSPASSSGALAFAAGLVGVPVAVYSGWRMYHWLRARSLQNG